MTNRGTCPSCGFNSISPAFNFCPSCGEAVSFIVKKKNHQMKSEREQMNSEREQMNHVSQKIPSLEAQQSIQKHEELQKSLQSQRRNGLQRQKTQMNQKMNEMGQEVNKKDQKKYNSVNKSKLSQSLAQRNPSTAMERNLYRKDATNNEEYSELNTIDQARLAKMINSIGEDELKEIMHRGQTHHIQKHILQETFSPDRSEDLKNDIKNHAPPPKYKQKSQTMKTTSSKNVSNPFWYGPTGAEDENIVNNLSDAFFSQEEHNEGHDSSQGRLYNNYSQEEMNYDDSQEDAEYNDDDFYESKKNLLYHEDEIHELRRKEMELMERSQKLFNLHQDTWRKSPTSRKSIPSTNATNELFQQRYPKRSKKMRDFNYHDIDPYHPSLRNPNTLAGNSKYFKRASYDDIDEYKSDKPFEEYEFMKTWRSFKRPQSANSRAQSTKRKNALDTELQFGARCELITHPRKLRGSIQYVGPVLGRKGRWVGIELDEPEGSHDGSLNGKRYFFCQYMYGEFVKPDQINVGNYPPSVARVDTTIYPKGLVLRESLGAHTGSTALRFKTPSEGGGYLPSQLKLKGFVPNPCFTNHILKTKRSKSASKARSSKKKIKKEANGIKKSKVERINMKGAILPPKRADLHIESPTLRRDEESSIQYSPSRPPFPDPKDIQTKHKSKSRPKSVFQRISDPRLFTGVHRYRFNLDGTGKGKIGRDAPAKGKGTEMAWT